MTEDTSVSLEGSRTSSKDHRVLTKEEEEDLSLSKEGKNADKALGKDINNSSQALGDYNDRGY